MPIEVEGPDGTVVDFPDDTPPETIKAAMAKHYARAKLPDGETLEVEVPADADDETIRRIGQEALDTRNIRGRAVVEPPSASEAIGASAQNALGQLGIGAWALPDMVNEATHAIGKGIVTGGVAIADPLLRAAGADGAANAVRDFGGRVQDDRAPTMGAFIERTNPAVNQPGNALANFGFQVIGGSAVPFGPRGAAPMRAPVAAAPAKPASSKLVPFADEIVASGKREGVPVMTTDIKPPRTMMGKAARNIGERIPLLGTGGERAGQNQARIEAATRMVQEYGGSEADAVTKVAADLAATRGAELSKLTTAKNSVISSIQGAVPAQALDRSLKAISAQITRLQGINADAFAPVIAKLKNFEEVLQSGKTLEQIEGNRKLLGDLFADPSLAAIKGDGQKALNAIYGPLRDDMGAFIEARGGPAAKAKWQGANARLAAMAGELKSSAFKKVLNDAETTPEGAARLIFSKTPSEVERLAANLSEAGKTKARSAVMFEAARRSTDNGTISPEKFATALEAMSTSIRGLFKDADAGRIEGMVRLLRGTQRASGAGVMTNSGQELVPAVMGATAVTQPYLVITAGLAARAYESGPIRDLLLKLGRAKPGTQGYNISFERLNAALAKMTPPAANDVKGALAQTPLNAAADTPANQVEE